MKTDNFHLGPNPTILRCEDDTGIADLPETRDYLVQPQDGYNIQFVNEGQRIWTQPKVGDVWTEEQLEIVGRMVLMYQAYTDSARQVHKLMIENEEKREAEENADS